MKPVFYYREVVLETDENIKFNLADIPLVNGILRVDKNNSDKPISLRLGHYALPKLDKEISVTKTKVKGYGVTIIDNRKDQLAMVPVLGWDKTEVITAKGLHPESIESAVVNVSADFISKNEKSSIYATLMVWKKSGEKWNKNEVIPIIFFEQINGSVVIQFINGTKKLVDLKK